MVVLPSPSAPTHGAWVDDWLSQPRFSKYLADTGGDEQRALDLYEWNSAISASFMHDLAHLEVAVRNAYNRALNTRSGGVGHWVHDPATFPPLLRTKKQRSRRVGPPSGARVDINDRPRKTLARAIADVGGRAAPPDKVVAQLSFGFWRYLSSTAHDATLWRDCLYRAFPPGTARQDVDVRMRCLHILRNRAAHHERLLDLDLKQAHEGVQYLATLINSTLPAHLLATSTVAPLLDARP